MYNPLFPLQEGFSPTWAGRPRRLVKAERILWQWWRQKFGLRFEEYWFDVALDGQPAREESLPGLAKVLSPKYRRLWRGLTAKRADVIGRRGYIYQIIEIRSDIRPQTIGEVEVYKSLAVLEFPHLSFGRSIIVGSTADEVLRKAIEAKRIKLFLQDARVLSSV